MLASSFGESAYGKEAETVRRHGAANSSQCPDLKWLFTDTWQTWGADPWPRAVFLTMLILRTATMVTVWIKRQLRVEVFAETAPFITKSGRNSDV
jgi:hypothetical protein